MIFGSLVGFLRRLQLLDLSLDDVILDLLEEEAGLAERVPSFDEVATAEVGPSGGGRMASILQSFSLLIGRKGAKAMARLA